MSESDKNVFWQFSLEFYARPGVAELCLQLQDDYLRHVNSLLWCLWLGQQGIRLDLDSLEQAERQLLDLRLELLQPMRALRRRLKSHTHSNDNLYRKAKGLELAIEQEEQRQLFELSFDLAKSTTEAGASFAQDNLQLYLSSADEAEWALAEQLLALMEK